MVEANSKIIRDSLEKLKQEIQDCQSDVVCLADILGKKKEKPKKKKYKKVKETENI